MPAPAEALLDRVAPAIRANLPPGVTPAYFDGFLRRNRPQLVAILDQHLRARRPRSASDLYVEATQQPPDLWSAAQRTAANLAAMRLAARKRPDEMSPADRQTLAAYSGWGGLSITNVASQFPTGFPVPEERGLIHEYYTPTRVAREVARVIKSLLPDLPRTDGHILTLEPSAGIGRFVQAASGHGFEDLRWHVVEWSELSSRMLAALRPDVDLTQGPFERWVREHGPDVAGRIGLVLANPPYGQRGAAVTEDPDRAYREKAAYAYFLRRALDLLAPNGLGVFLVPAGFVSGGSDALRSLREKVLLRHHLAAAYRLPSTIFPGAMLVTDLLFFRARGGALTEVDVADRSILDGRYFLDHPEHVLGTEVGKDAGDDDQTRKPRWGYQVVGTFERLPDLHERPICDACTIDRNVLVFPGASKRSRPAATAPEGLSEALTTAYALGQRVDRYLAALSAQTTDEHVQLWPELVEALGAWTKAHGNPWARTDLRVAASGQRPFERFLQAFTKSGALIAGLATRPTWTPRYAGRPDDLVALAERGDPRGRTDSRERWRSSACGLCEGDFTGARWDEQLTGGPFSSLTDVAGCWARSGTQTRDAAHFYVPSTFSDPFGSTTTLTWHGSYLVPASVTDPLGNETSATYPNGDRTEVAYDALGRPVAMALTGQSGGTDGDSRLSSARH
jgi:YD repeat-containing protein